MGSPYHQVSLLSVAWGSILLSFMLQWASFRDSRIIGLHGHFEGDLAVSIVPYNPGSILVRAVPPIVPPHITAFPRRSTLSSVSTRANFTTILLLLSGDIALNPGPQRVVNPRPANFFPCGHCELNVSLGNQGMCCSVWFHRSCHDMSMNTYGNLKDVSWRCYRCHTPLWDTFHSYELSDNIAQPINNSTLGSPRTRIASDHSLTSPNSFRPTQHSTPEAHPPHASAPSPRGPFTPARSSVSSDSNTPLLPAKHNNWRTLIVNTNSLVSDSKKAEFANLVDYTKPDAILVSESS